MKISSKISSWLTLSMLFLIISTTAQSGVVYTENFDDGVADDWTLGQNTLIDSDPINATPSLFIDTDSPTAVALTPLFDLRFIASATLMFDFSQPASPGPQATRWVDLDFFNGSTWVPLARLKQNSAATSGLSYTVTSGFTDANQFRFTGKGDSGGSRFVAIDNVSLELVSAPQTLAMFGVVGLLLVSLRRKA